jgi:DNA-binding NarL/FixJ family response regulator
VAFEDGAHFTLDEAISFALGEHRENHPPGSPRAARPEPGPLTPRELQVADLVAQGLTNKQIAARLVVSQRTAEGHVQNILTTLGFTSRAQIASWMTRRNQSEAGHS